MVGTPHCHAYHDAGIRKRKHALVMYVCMCFEMTPSDSSHIFIYAVKCSLLSQRTRKYLRPRLSYLINYTALQTETWTLLACSVPPKQTPKKDKVQNTRQFKMPSSKPLSSPYVHSHSIFLSPQTMLLPSPNYSAGARIRYPSAEGSKQTNFKYSLTCRSRASSHQLEAGMNLLQKTTEHHMGLVRSF